MRYPGRPGRRRGWTHPDIAGFLTGTGLDVLDIPTGLAPRALRDIRAGRPRAGSPCRRPRSRSAPRPGPARAAADVPAAPDRVIETTVDQLAEAELRLLGVPRRRGRPPYRLPSGHRGLVAAGWLLPTVWTGLTGWGQARCGPRRSGRQRADCRGLWWYRVLRRGRSRPGAAGADAGRGIRFVFFQGLPVQEGPGQPVQPVPAAQGGQCLLVALLDDPPGFGVDQLSGGGGDTVGGLVLAGGRSSRPELIRSGVLSGPGGLRGLLRPAGPAGTPRVRARVVRAAVRAWLRGRPGWRRRRRRWRRARSARAGR